MDATISVVCYKSKTLSNGEHPLMLRISKDGKKKYQSLGISVNPKFWDFQKNKPKPKCPNLEFPTDRFVCRMEKIYRIPSL